MRADKYTNEEKSVKDGILKLLAKNTMTRKKISESLHTSLHRATISKYLRQLECAGIIHKEEYLFEEGHSYSLGKSEDNPSKQVSNNIAQPRMPIFNSSVLSAKYIPSAQAKRYDALPENSCLPK